MKRPSRKQREYSLRVTRKRTRRRAIQKEKARIRRGATARCDRRSHRKLTQQTIDLVAPVVFYVGEVRLRKQLLHFFGRIRQAIRKGFRVRISLRRTRMMHPCGTLLFLAELDRLQKSASGTQLFQSDYPSSRLVEQVLQQTGILALLRKKERLLESGFPESVKHWRAASGTTVEGEKFEPMVTAAEGRLAKPLTRGLYVGVTEAMTNCAHHAYEALRGDGIANSDNQRRWWMFSQERDGYLSVCFCDLGIGIPRSVETSGIWDPSFIQEIIQDLGLGTIIAKEARLIRAALELHKTSTKLAHRGKGLPQILDVISKAGAGFLQIHSNKGSYRFTAATKQDQLYDFAGSIRGTLIQWNIPLASQSAEAASGGTSPEDQLAMAGQLVLPLAPSRNSDE